MRTIKRYTVLAALAAVSVTAVIPSAVAARGQERNIVQTAAAAGQFNTLLALAKHAGLAGTLAGKGPFTVFAPTDAAFAKVPKSVLNSLKHNRRELRAVLLYHVLKGRIRAAKLVKLHSVKTLNGQSLTVRVKHGTVSVGRARVIKANIAASNGVIHVINRVLIPR
jgi:uncharacterized surface protein with fasciclin (FAS1) repeats